jgi:hypothetical protein
LQTLFSDFPSLIELGAGTESRHDSKPALDERREEFGEIARSCSMRAMFSLNRSSRL